MEPKAKNGDRWVERLMEYGLIIFGFFVMVAKLNHMLEYLFFTLVGVWVIWALVTKKPFRRKRTPVDLPLFCFLIWIPLTFFGSLDPSYSFSEWRKALAHVLMLYFVVHVIEREGQVFRILHAIAAGAMLIALLAIFQYVEMGWSPFDMTIRGYSLTSESQWMSTYLIMCLPLCWFGWATEGPPSIQWTYGAGMGIILCGIFLSHTRSAWLTLIIILAVYVLLKVFRQGILIVGGALLLVVVFMVALAQSDQVRNMFISNEFTNPKTMMLRFDTWKYAMEDIEEHPILGIGFGKHTFGKKHPDAEEMGIHTHIHNMFLAKAVQAGLPGLVLFSWVFLCILKTTFRTWQEAPRSRLGELSLAIFLMTLAVIIRNFFDDMFIGTLAYLFWMLVGLYLVLFLSGWRFREPGGEKPDRAERPLMQDS